MTASTPVVEILHNVTDGDSHDELTAIKAQSLRGLLLESLPENKKISQNDTDTDSTTQADLSGSTTPPSFEGSDLSLSDGAGSVHSFSSENDLLNETVLSATVTVAPLNESEDEPPTAASFTTLRITYLLVTLVIMLADGLQGTHLYVLYEGYGFSVAYLYCLGFATGGIMSPITGPLVDKIGRKKAAILYCVLEIFINMLEQYPFLSGLIVSRMIGGFTTNLLSSVFETWLDTEYRKRGFAKEKYEIIMRDSVIVSNLAAIFSGYLAHVLAERYGAVGPFEGAVTCTAVALVVVCAVWTENYGSEHTKDVKGMIGYFNEAVTAFRDDSRMLRVGILQGLTVGSVQIFVYLWSPTLRHFAKSADGDEWGLDKSGEPAYGLIFGAFMGAGVLGGLAAPTFRKLVTAFVIPLEKPQKVDGEVEVRPMAVEFLVSSCYILSALMMFVPSLCPDLGSRSFSWSLLALLVYEFLIGVFLPCEGVIRSLYFPTNARASIMALPRVIVNVAVALAVVSTNFISLKTAFFLVGCLMIIAAGLQLSLISEREWSSIYSRADRLRGSMVHRAKRLSSSVSDLMGSSASLVLEFDSDSSFQFDDSSGKRKKA